MGRRRVTVVFSRTLTPPIPSHVRKDIMETKTDRLSIPAYLTGSVAAMAADTFFVVLLAWAAQLQTGNPVHVGLIFAANLLPKIFLTMHGGASVDQRSVRSVLLTGNLLQASGLLAITLWLTTGDLSVVALYALAMLFGAVDAYNLPALATALPRLYPDENRRMTVMGRVDAAEYIAQFSALLGAGFLIELYGLTLAMTVNVALYLIAAALFASFRLNSLDPTLSERRSQESSMRRIKEGVVHLWRKPELRANGLLMLLGGCFFWGTLTVGLLLMVSDLLGSGPIAFGLAYAGFSVGAIAGAVLSGRLARIASPPVWLALRFVLIGFVLIVMPWLANVVLVGTGFALTGFIVGSSGVITATWVQKETDPAMYGRVGAANELIDTIGRFVSRALAGLLATLSVATMFTVAGVAMLVVTAGVVVTMRTVFVAR